MTFLSVSHRRRQLMSPKIQMFKNKVDLSIQAIWSILHN